MNISFRGAVLTQAVIVRTKKGDPVRRLYFAADLTDTVINKMQWGKKLRESLAEKVGVMLDGYKLKTEHREQLHLSILKMFETSQVVPDGMPSARLEGSLSAKKIKLVPADKELAKSYRTEWDVNELTEFTVTAIHNADGDDVRLELRFQVISTMKEAVSLAETFMSEVGQAPSRLDVIYQKQMKLGEDQDEESEESDQPELVGAEA